MAISSLGNVGAQGPAAAVVLMPATKHIKADGIGFQTNQATPHHGFGQSTELGHEQKYVHWQIDVDLSALLDRDLIQTDGLVGQARPERQQPFGGHADALAVEIIFHFAFSKPVESRYGHDGVERPSIEA
ncbi:hypothetical protein PSQ19_09405 [Devosia algicola]|uniref:Uncharacterized protein n=1 Tax=Devosia algicola TaxID=3026418 RepID=A0ABY7YSB4_9HYPH|nr:hypothetical protein [Devosia algicola]WDR04181.1 hypothetical protein PSQ19_09405 [Devosia algicola]